MATPNITLTATLDDLLGAAAGSTANPARLRLTLCNYGPSLPRVAGTAMIAKPGPFDTLDTGSGISIVIWGNDQIEPSGTYYTVEILDGNQNVVQTSAYIFSGGPKTVALPDAVPILPGQPQGIAGLSFEACTGAVPGTAYTAPGTVIAVAYNGLFLQPGQSLPVLSYTLSGGTTINLNFTTEVGDLIYALCIVD